VKSSNVTCSKYSDISPQFFFFRFWDTRQKLIYRQILLQVSWNVRFEVFTVVWMMKVFLWIFALFASVSEKHTFSIFSSIFYFI
jgi:hypothetical protein